MLWDQPPKLVLPFTLISDTFGAVELPELQGFVASDVTGRQDWVLSLFSEDLTLSVLNQCLSGVRVSTAPDQGLRQYSSRPGSTSVQLRLSLLPTPSL